MVDNKRKSSRQYDLNKKSLRHYDLSKPPARSFDLEKEGEIEATVTGAAASPAVSQTVSHDPSSKKSKRKIATVLGIVATVLAVGLIWHFVAGKNGEKKEEIAQNVAEKPTSNQEVFEEDALLTDAGAAIGEESVDERGTEVVSGEGTEHAVSDETNGAASSREEPVTGSTTGIATSENDNAGLTESATTSGQSSTGEPSGVASKPVGQTSSSSETTKVGASNSKPDSKTDMSKATSVTPGQKPEASGVRKPVISKAEQVALWDALDAQAKEVILGVYGIGKARAEALGDSYDNIQAKVNEYYRAKYGK